MKVPTPMDLRQIEYVLAALDHDGFTGAAQALGVTQPSVSQGVRSLESELGVDLFTRIGRRVVPSPAGLAFSGPAREVVRAAAATREAVRNIADVTGGTLELAALPTLAVDPLVPIISAFRTAYPGVAIRVTEPDEKDDMVDLLKSGRAEVGITDLAVVGGGLITARLLSQELVAVGPPGDRPAGGRVEISDLTDVPLIVTPRGTSTRSLIERTFEACGVLPNIVIEMRQRDAIAALVASGAGWSILPRAVTEEAERRGAIVVEIDPPISRSIGLVTRNEALSPAARAFVALALPSAL
jgi:LysR family transcriptional regulator, carnitine catabolism transcriptional activator